MRGAMYLRDARHLDKSMYMPDRELFYEPLEARYEPLEAYVSLVTGLLRDLGKDWATARHGFWFHVHPRQLVLPVQGWKVHVSATSRNGGPILAKAAKVALLNDMPFKFALDRNVLSLMNSKRWHRGGSGKFITLYPSDLSSFKDILEQLYAQLHRDEGPYILSDKRYKDCRVLYYRYGGMAQATRMDFKGEKIPVLLSPEGEATPDVRTPYFAPPPWAADPFPGQELEQQQHTLNAGRYLVKQALGFSNSGGVYLAEDRHTGREVAIKEARAHTAVDRQGNDAVKRLKIEWEILGLLADTGFTPRPLELFQDWENFFLVEEYVDGVDGRDLMLTHSPLLRVRPSLQDAIRYWEIFRKVSRSLAGAVHLLHERGVVFGDLSPANIKIDLSTYAVKLIDLEAAFRGGVDEPTDLHTPGFRSALRVHSDAPGFADDLYSLAAVMLYMLFPIAALSSLRADLFDTVLRTILSDIGWSQTEAAKVIGGLSRGDIACTRVCELLDKPARILPPRFNDEIEAHACDKMSRELSSFLLASMRPSGKGGLFPADPFMYQTNSLSLGFGACGVLYALKKSGAEVPRCAFDWLERELDSVKPDSLPPGLFTGASGIAWCLWELGFQDRAVEFAKMANSSAMVTSHHSYLYGMAGVGLTNLFLYVHTKRPDYLVVASDLADSLLKVAQESDRGIYWESDGLVHLGYGYGQSGVALFFLRLFQVSGKEKFLSAGRRALQFDLSHSVEHENGVLSFPRAPSVRLIEPYLEEGSAGVAKVAMRYGIWDRMEMILSDVHRKYAVFPGLLFGLGSFVDVLTDAFLFSGNAGFLQMARRPIAGIRDIYLIRHRNGSALPGDGLFRISCDYATGVGGVLRALHRFTHFDQADFVLDEIISAGADPSESLAAAAQRRATPKVGQVGPAR